MSRRGPDLVRLAALAGAVLAGGLLAGMLGYLAWGAWPVLRAEGIDFVFNHRWSYRRALFGAGSMLAGTVVVSAIAIALATPLALGTALFVSEICTPRLRTPFKAAVELLAGIPSVVYGLLGVLVLRDRVARALSGLGVEVLSGDTLLTAGLLLAVMILPTVATLAEDALRSVPRSVREAARALGMSRAESACLVALPRALPGVGGAVLLGLGRALGETIAVFLVVGRADNRLPTSWRAVADAGQTLTSKLGGSEVHLSVGDPLHSSAMLGLGLLLLLLVLFLAGGAELLRRRPEAR